MRLLAALAPTVLLVAAAPAVSPAIRAALANPARADQAGDDTRREAAAVLAFAGVKPGDRVVDFLPGKGYWTRIFTGIVGPKGHVTAMWPAASDTERGRAARDAITALGLPNVTAEIQTTPLPTVAQPVDLFWTVQNYHDIPAAALPAFNAAVLKALKPGGTYLVIDHADAPGAVPTTPSKHRIDPAVVKSQVTAAGFRFVGASNVLANPADDHSKPVFDPSLRGHTDQFVFKFRKPG